MALKWLLNFKNPEGQMARLIERLQFYDFNLEYRAWWSHQNADPLSQKPCEESYKYCEHIESKKELRRIQAKKVQVVPEDQ